MAYNFLDSVLNVAQIPASWVDTDNTLAANSDSKIASQKAIKAYADGLIGANNAMVFKGVQDCSTDPNYPAASLGWVYKVSVAGKIGGASGVNVEIGDEILCTTTTTSGDHAAKGANWAIIQGNIDGAVTGPASCTDTRVAVFSGTTGKVIADGGKSVADFYLATNPSGFTANAGTVTAVSVVSANGFAGSSGGGATPALTLSTSITGILKGNGTAISAASAGTDYASPSQSFYIGTTSVTIDRASAALSLAGVSIDGAAASFTGNLTGDVTSTGMATTLGNAPVIGKVLTGLSTGTGGTVAATDSILAAFGRLENRMAGNDAKISWPGVLTTPVVTKTGAYTLTGSDSNCLVNAAGGAITITLPTAASIAGRQYTVKKVDDTVNVVSVATTASQTIDGLASPRTIPNAYESLTFVSDGSNWFIV